jgi:alkylation response protein AidB-like acyl-CoA dehydrogenase
MAAMPHAVPPTPPDVLAAAQALAPRLRALASDAERRRAMTDEAVDALGLACRHAVHTAADTVSRLFRVGGIQALYDDHPLQRALRDVHAVTLHGQLGLHHFERLGRSLVATFGT